MNKLPYWTFLHVLGISGYVGTIFAMIVLGRMHDFSADWQEILTSRTDIWNILLYANLPSFALALATDFFIWRVQHSVYPKRLVRIKWALNSLCIILTIGIIAGAAHSMVTLAHEAALDTESAALFRSTHLREDIAGPINLAAFLASTAIGIRLFGKAYSSRNISS